MAVSHRKDQFFDDIHTLFGPFESKSAFQKILIQAMKENMSRPWNDIFIGFLEAVFRHKNETSFPETQSSLRTWTGVERFYPGYRVLKRHPIDLTRNLAGSNKVLLI